MKSSLGGWRRDVATRHGEGALSSGLRADVRAPDRAKALAYMRSFRPWTPSPRPTRTATPGGTRSSSATTWLASRRRHLVLVRAPPKLRRDVAARRLAPVALLEHGARRERGERDEHERSLADGAREPAAMLLWGRAKSKSGAVDDADRDAALGVVVSDAVVMVLISIGTVYMYRLKRRKERGNDQRMITLDDYTVEVHGLPEDVDEAAVRAHFERHGELHDVTFGRDLHELIALRRKLFDLEGKHDVLEFMLQRARKILGEHEPDAGGARRRRRTRGGAAAAPRRPTRRACGRGPRRPCRRGGARGELADRGARRGEGQDEEHEGALRRRRRRRGIRRSARTRTSAR